MQSALRFPRSKILQDGVNQFGTEDRELVRHSDPK